MTVPMKRQPPCNFCSSTVHVTAPVLLAVQAATCGRHLSNSMCHLQQRCDDICGGCCNDLAAGGPPVGTPAAEVSRDVSPIVQAVPGGRLKGLEEWTAHFHSS